jgi:hypothetical protein
LTIAKVKRPGIGSPWAVAFSYRLSAVGCRL